MEKRSWVNGKAVVVEDIHHEQAVPRQQQEPRPPAFQDFFHTPCSRAELAQQRKRFLLFLRILTKYLNIKDQDAYDRVRDVLRRFASSYERSTGAARLPPGSPSRGACAKPVLSDMCNQVRNAVSRTQWDAALSLLDAFLLYQRKRRTQPFGRGEPGKPALVSADGS